jgi:hypothetical protein
MKIKNANLLKDLLIEALSHVVFIETKLTQEEKDAERPKILEFSEALIENTSQNDPNTPLKNQIIHALREVLFRQSFEVHQYVTEKIIKEEQSKVDALIEVCKNFISPTLLKIRLALYQMEQEQLLVNHHD